MTSRTRTDIDPKILELAGYFLGKADGVVTDTDVRALAVALQVMCQVWCSEVELRSTRDLE